MSVTSANINDLQTFLTGSQSRYERLAETLTTVTTKANTVTGACTFNHPSTPSLSALNELLGSWQVNQAYVQVVRNELIEADQLCPDGMATVADTAIDATLKANGLDKAPDLVDVDAIEMYGQPPYSGFIDDPICLANGNFLLREGDLAMYGVASGLSVVRTYNSRDRRSGVFGVGWSSQIDTALLVEGGRITFRAPDGSGTVFHRLDDGTWSVNRRRRLTLVPDDAGWEVREGHDRSWHFDEGGRCTRLVIGGADVHVEHTASSVRLTDQTSGRWVSYARSSTTGVVESVESSDGRTASYTYDPLGRLTVVHRDAGDVGYEHDERGFVSVVTDADGIVVCRNVYDREGRVLSQVENHGRETRYEYRADGVSTVTASDDAPPNVMVHDRRGRMTAMIDGLGNTMRMAYDDQDEIVQIVDRTGAVTRYVRDHRGNLLERIDPDGLSHHFTWDDADRLVAETDRAGATTSYHYDGDQRVPVRVVQADGSEVHATYNALDVPTSILDADGVSAQVEWNRDGLVAAMVDGLGEPVTFTYDAAGRTIGAEAPEGISASADLDPAGRVLALRTAIGERRYAYSAAGRMVGGQAETGVRWRAELDAAGEPSVVAAPSGVPLGVERDSVGRVSAAVAPDGSRTAFEHDPVGRRTATIDPVGHRTEFGYDPEGRAVQVTDPSGRTRSRDLDVLGRTTMAVGPDGGTTIRSYHPAGALASFTDAAGHQWTYEVDLMGRVTSSTDPLGGVTEYRYTPAGRLSEVRSPMGRVVRREYDGAGRLARVVEPDGTAVRFERRADGALSRVLRAGVVTSVDYDESGRRSAIAGPWGSLSVEREAGRVSSLSTNGADAASCEYDPRGFLSRVTDPAGVVTEFTRDLCGRLVAQQTGESETSFTWDRTGRLASVVDAHGNATSFDRDPRGVIERVSRADGTTSVRTFDAAGRITGAVDPDGTALLTVHRDQNGMIVGADGSASRTRMERNAIGCVTAVETGAGRIDYSWDADGYLTAFGDDSGHRVVLDREPGSRLLGFDLADGRHIDLPGDAPVQRDADGRVEVDEHGRRFGYDSAGRLARADVAGSVTTYDYDDRGLLASERTAGGVRRYRYGRAGELLATVHEDGGETRFEYDPTGRRLAEVQADGGRVDYRWDALGRLVAVVRTDAEGNEVTDRIEQDAFGRPERINDVPILWDSAATGSLLGVGHRRYLWWGSHVLEATDPTATWSRCFTDDPWGDDGGTGPRLGYRGELALDHLVFLGARVYDTRTRSFLSRDPLPSVPGTVSFAGVYGYAGCDPVNLVDPSGQRPLSDEEYSEFREQASKGLFRSAWDAVKEDPWGWAGKAALMVGGVVISAVAIATLGPVGALLVCAATGAIVSGGTTAIDGGSLTDIARSAVVGGVLGGLSFGMSKYIPASAATSVGLRVLDNTARQVPQQFGLAGLEEAGTSYLPGGDGDMSLENVVINGTVGTVANVGAAEVQYRRTTTADVDTGPAPDPDGTGTGPAPDNVPDELTDPTMGTDTPEAGVPDPGRDMDDFNGLTSEQLQDAHGIGPATADAIVEHRSANGPYTSADDVLDVKGVGPARRDALRDAGLLP